MAAKKKARKGTRKKATRKRTKAKAAKKPSPAFEFTRAFLKRRPKASYQDLKEAAAKKRLTIAPILYGRVQALLGIVKMSGYGQSKKQRGARKAPPANGRRRRPGRPRKVQQSPLTNLNDVVHEIQQIQAERDRVVAVLEEVRELLSRV